MQREGEVTIDHDLIVAGFVNGLHLFEGQMPGWAQLILAFGIGFIGLPSALFLPMLMFWLVRDTPEQRAEFFRSRSRKHTIHAFALMCAVTLVLAFFRNSVS